MTRPNRVSLFVTCLVDQFFPAVGLATSKVLERCGLKVDFPEAQTCCGQPAFNSGYHEEARRVARTLLRAFSGAEAVVGPSGSCVAMVRNGFPELFHDSPAELAAARALAAKTYEFSEFLVQVLGREDVGAPPWRDGPITYHESCHLLRELKVREPARQLLGRVPGLELREMERPDDCCGFGGTFSVKFGSVSTAIGDEKLRAVAATGARTLVACDMSCLMHLDGRARRSRAKTGAEALAGARQRSGAGCSLRCLHLAQVLAGES